MANEVKITLSADGNGLRLAVDGAVQDLGKLGKAASTAANDATTSLGATRRGILSISEQLATAQGTVLAYGKAMAAAFVGGQAVAMIKEIALLNARYEELGVVMPVVGRNAGYTATQMNAAASEMQKLGISMTESRNTTIQLAQAQISLADAGKLARIAQDAAVVGNMNSSEALASMIHGIKSGQIEVLRTIGINVNFEQSYKALANQIGVTTEELSEKQKMQARENAVLEEGAKLTGAYEAAMGTAGKQMRSMARYAEDLKVIRGEVFNEALTVGVMAFVDQLKDANQQSTNLANNGKLKEWGNDVADTFAFVADAGLSAVAVIKMAGITAGYLAAQVFSDNDNKTGEQIAAASNARDAAYKEDMAALLRSTSAMRDALAKRRAALKSDADARLALQSEFATKSVAVQKAYANHSLEVQRAAQLALAKGLFPQEYPDAPKDAQPVVKSNKAQQSAYESLAKAIREKVAEVENEITAGKKLTDGEKLEARYKDELKDKLKGLSAARRAELEAGLQRLAQDEKTLEAAKKVRDAAEDTAKEIAKYAKAQQDAIVAANAEVTAAQAAYDAHGKLKSVIAEEELARLENNRAIIAGYEDTTVLDAQIAAKKRLIDVLRNGEVRDAAEKTAKDAAAEWQKASDQIQQSLSDALMNAFTAGKGFGKTFVNSIKALFNTMVLRPVISAIVSPVSGALTSALGFSGAANAAGTGGSLLSSGADLLGLGSTLAGAGTFMGQLGTGLLASTQTALGLTATAAQASYAASMGVAAQTGSLIGSLGPLISAAPYLVALAGVYMLAKKLDKSGTPHSGGGAMYSAGGGLQTQGLANGWSGGGAYLTDFGGFKVTEDATKMAAGIAQSVVGLLDSAAVTFGQKAGYTAATAFADDSSTDGAWGALAIKLGDTMVTEWAQWANGPGGTTFSDGSAGSAEYLAKISSDVRTVLNGIDMPQWAKKVLNDLPDGATLQQMGEAVAAITKTQTAWERLGKTLAGFGAMSDEAKVKLTSASGGIDALVTNASAYYDNFYTEGDRTAATLGSIKDAFDAVAVPMPATREAFRTLVESLEATADTNPYASAALATVLSMAGAFASVVPAAAAAEEAATSLVDTVEEIATLGQELDALRNPVRTIKDVAQGIFSLEREGASLQVELWRTYGDSNSLLAANKLQRDIETSGMTAQEVALYDLNAARRAEIDTILQQRQAQADAVASWQAYFDLVATPQEKQTRARAIVQAVLPADVDTLQEYKDYVWGLTVQFGLGSAEMKAATDVAQQFALAFPEVAQEITEVSAASTVLTKDLSAFRSGFFTAAEQTALATQDMTAALQALGLTTLPASNEEFRALALGIDTSTESGKMLFNGLMGLAGGFAQLHPLVTSVTEVVATLDSAIASLRASGASRTVDQIAGNMLTLEEQIFQLQNAGNTAALRQHTLDGLSDVKDSLTGLSERDLQGLVWSLQDTAQAALDLAAANKIAEDEAARAADAIASEMQRAADAAAAAAQRIASEHDSLWRQWLTANEDTAALRALDLAALDPSNRALQEQIWALEDQKKAAEEATSAAEQMKSAWGSLTDSMIDEVRRIRGLMDESSGAGYASLASQFATATAQSRAGDQTAAKLLPGLSQSMLTAYEASATSLVDLQRVRALTANSLEQTAGLLGASPQTLAAALPNGTATATGTALNSYAPAAVTAPGPSLTDVVTELRAEIAALKDELKGMRGEAKATSETIAINTGKTARLNQKWDDVGLPITTETDLVAVYGA